MTAKRGLILNDGTLMSFYDADLPNCLYGGAIVGACGAISIDVNGFKGPNRWGRDIFVFIIVNKPQNSQFVGLIPYGSLYSNIPPPWTNFSGCVSTVDGQFNGLACAGRVIQENGMNY